MNMAEVKVKLRPFTVPNFVIVEEAPRARQEGFRESPKYALHELDDETIRELIDEFRKNVWAKVSSGRAGPERGASHDDRDARGRN
jgi:hypothetical protein